jgi:zinc transport system ATP-binding protein
MQSNSPILTVEHLTVRRGHSTAVRDVSFSLAAGKDMAIVGPNGAGKSTLIQAILGLLPYQAGNVKLFGTPCDRDTAPLLRHDVAYLPQNFLVDPRIPMTVMDLVGLGWDRLGLQLPWVGWRDRRAAVHTALAQVEALHLQHQSLSSLSGGELKRVLLAYCVVRPRKLLVLDEAPAGLDVCGEGDFYRLLNHLKREQGWSILQISHDLERVRAHCDCVLCLNQQLLKQGSPAEVLSPDILNQAYGSGFVCA